MLPLMIMDMEAQSFNEQGLALNRQGLTTQSQLNGQGLELPSARGYTNTVGYSGIVMESSSSMFGGEGGWGYHTTPSYYIYNNNINSNNNINHQRYRLLQGDDDNVMITRVGDSLVVIDIAHHITMSLLQP